MKTMNNQPAAILADGDNTSAECREDVIRFVSKKTSNSRPFFAKKTEISKKTSIFANDKYKGRTLF